MNAKWTSDDVPGQQGRLAVVTGANTGLGFETARVLAARGASVVLAVRNIENGKRAAARIADTAPGANVMVQHLDLTSLDSIHGAADELQAKHPRIDLLINNAGGMFTPKQTTRDGFELQFGTNHLGPFALTGLLLEQMLPDPGGLCGQYYGPGGFFGARGYPKLAESSGQSHDTAIQRRLWAVSEELTGVTFPV